MSRDVNSMSRRSHGVACPLALTLLLAAVLSSLEIERRGPVRQPAPIVVMLTDPPGPRRRSRPYRAHHRRTSVAGW
jgi:hypothetical protein